MAQPGSQSTAASISKALMLVLCAGAGCALAGPAGGAAGAATGSVLGGIIGSHLSNIAGGIASEFANKFTDFFGGTMTRATAHAPNHDLAALAAHAVHDTIGAANSAIGVDHKFTNAVNRIHGANIHQIAATLADVPSDAMDEQSILGVIGTPMGGNDTTTKTPAFWLWVANDLAKKTGAHSIKTTGLKSALRSLTEPLRTDLDSEEQDPHANDAIRFIADFLHRHAANQVNDHLRSNTDLGHRARAAAEFAYLRAILDTVREQHKNVALAADQLEAIKAAVADRCDALAKEPAWFTEDNAAFAKSLREHAEAAANQLAALGADVTAIRNTLAIVVNKLESLSRQMADGFEMVGVELKVVKDQLHLLRSGTLSAATLKTAGNLAAAKVAPNQFFTGRENELARLHAAMQSGSVAIVHALTGEGGIGKTELAKVYALIYADTYTSVWWIDASAAALRGELIKVYELATGKEAPQNAQVDALCQALVDHWKGSRPLVILDNVDDAANFTLFSALPTARILATTRQNHKTLQGVEPFQLGVLPIKDAVALMRKEIARHRNDVTDADLTAIAEELGGHALAVALAGAYLANYAAYSAQEVLTKLKASKVGDIDPVADEAEHNALGLSYRKSVAASLSLSFALDEVKPALPVLAAAAFLHPTGITIDWLMAGTGWEKDRVIKAAATLERFSILKSTPPTPTAPATYSLHPLTQGVARSRADVALSEAGALALAHLLVAVFELFRWPITPEAQLLDHVKTPQRVAALAHAEAVIGHADQVYVAAELGVSSPLTQARTLSDQSPAHALGAMVIRTRAELANRLQTLGQIAEAARHIDAAIEWGEKQAPRDERLLAIWYASRASIVRLRGYLAAAEEDIQRSIDWGENQSPRDECTLATFYSSRGSIRRLRGDLAGAEKDIQWSIEWNEKQSPRDERTLAIDYAARASIRQDRGDLAGAEEDIQKSIEWSEKQSPRDERSLAHRFASRASIRQHRNDLAGAEADIQKSIEWGENQFPRDERALAVLYASRSDIRQLRGDLDGAEEDIRRSIEWEERQTQRNQYSLAILYASRASIRQDRGDLQGAEEDIQQSIDWEERQTQRNQYGLAILYASRARIREDQALAARREGKSDDAARHFAAAKADIAAALTWWEQNLPGDERGLGILRRDQARIHAAADGAGPTA